MTQATFKCMACAFAANADRVGALNVLNRAGLILCQVAYPRPQALGLAARVLAVQHPARPLNR